MLYGDERAGGSCAVIDPLADGQIENTEAERREHDGPSAINRRVTIRNITPLLNGGQASLPPPPPGTAPPRR